jgi:hypothetical protein
MELEKINWKLFIKDPAVARPHDFFKVFNAWIVGSPEIFVDVADYQHVSDGPVTLLCGFHLDYVLDNTDRRLGLLYNHKQPMSGSNAQRLTSSLTAHLEACQRLENDPQFGGALKFNTGEIEFLINDRALAPNTPDTHAAVSPLLSKLFSRVYGKGNFSLTPQPDPKKRFAVTIQSAAAPALPSLIQNCKKQK